MKAPPPLSKELRIIHLRHETPEAGLQFLNGHPLRAKGDIEQCATLPGRGVRKTTFPTETLVERRSGEWRKNGYLRLI